MSIVQLLNFNELENSYEHTIDFPDLATQTSFFDNLVYSSIDLPTEDDYVYIRETKTIEVDINKNSLLGVNYLRFNNGNKWWYAFITGKTYINENVTSISFEVDVFQTFMFDYEIQESYVSREHQDRWNSNGKPIFNLRDETLDLGTDYVKTNDILINDNDEDVRVNCIMIVAGKQIEGNPDIQNISGPTNALADPLLYYLIPVVSTPTGNKNVYINNTNQKVMSAGRLFNDLKGREYGSGTYSGGTRDDLVDQQTRYANIISFSVLPYLPFEYTITQDGDNYIINAPDLNHRYLFWSDPITPYTINKGYFYSLSSDALKNNLRDLNVVDLLNIPNQLDYFTPTTPRNIGHESKLYTYPYQYLTLDCEQVEPLIIKPQYLDNLRTNIRFNQCIGPNPIVRYYLDGYKGDNGNDTSLINNTLNDLNVYTSKLIDYLANNKASATSGLAVNTALDVGVTALRTGIGVSTGNPFATSNAISDVKGIADRLINENFKRQDLSQGTLNYKAKGNNAYAFIQRYGNYNSGLKVRTYSIAEQFKRFAYNFFYHYGYKCNDFKVPDLKSRYYFNYIQMPDVSMFTKIDNEYIQKLKSIYSNGITIWHYRDANTWKGVSDYTYENVEMNLIGV